VDRRERPEHLDLLGREPELLLRLAQRRRRQVRILVLREPARERDLARVARQVFGPARQDEAVLDEREQHRGQTVARAGRRRGPGVQAALEARAHVAPVHSPPW